MATFSEAELLQCLSSTFREVQKIGMTLPKLATFLNENLDDIQHKTDVSYNGSNSSPYQTFHTFRSGILSSTKKYVNALKQMILALEPRISLWKAGQLHKCTYRRPVNYVDTAYVENLCKEVCKCLDHIMQIVVSRELQVIGVQEKTTSLQKTEDMPQTSAIIEIENLLREALQLVAERFLVVFDQPPLTMMTEKEKGSTKDKEDINKSKKFGTSVGIIGGDGFANHLVIEDVQIYLCYGKDLERGDISGITTFGIHTDSKADKRKSDPRPQDTPTHKRVFEDVHVEKFSRRDQKNVFKQVYHAVYNVRVYFSLMESRYDAQTLSLPIIVRTGANQASEHIGTQLWHSYSAVNVYDFTKSIAPSMKLGDVVNMMDERLRFIGGRGLMDYEKEFLLEKLAAQVQTTKAGPPNKFSQEITLDNFIKDKVVLTMHGELRDGQCSSTDILTERTDFSLWRWLHSIINLLETTLKQPWLDGFIYGFASRKHCQDVLEFKRPGTFLIRFSESKVIGNYEMTKGYVGVVFRGTEREVQFPPPIDTERIESSGLAERIEGIKVLGCDLQSFLGVHDCGVQEFNITELKRYSPPGEGKQTLKHDRYQGFIRREIIVPLEEMNLNDSSNLSSPMSIMDPISPAGSVTSCAPERKQPLAAKRTSKPNIVDDARTKQQRFGSQDSPSSIMSCVSSPRAMSPVIEENGIFPVGTTQNQDVASSNILFPVQTFTQDYTICPDSGQTLDMVNIEDLGNINDFCLLNADENLDLVFSDGLSFSEFILRLEDNS